MKKNKKYIVIVCANFTGEYLPFYFLGHGYQCIHVVTKHFLDKKGIVNPELFTEVFFLKNESKEEIIKLVENLKKFDIKAIIAGNEGVVTTTDTISQYFSVPKNDIALSIARRHKYYMIDALAKNGLSTQVQFIAKNISDLKKWYLKENLNKIILKPPYSASGDNVMVCHDLHEVEINFSKIYGATDFFGEKNIEVVAQEFVDGVQYIVNTVSCDDKHFITDIWRECGSDKEGLLHDDYAELVKENMQDYSMLENFSKEVLKSLKITDGPAHHEIRFSSCGPRLIEVGARLAGGMDPSALTEVFGYNQVSIAVEALLDPDSFKRRVTNMEKQKYARYIYLSSNKEGIIKNQVNLSEFFTIKSLHSMNFVFEQGDKLPITNQIILRPGRAYLISDSSEQIENDYQRFRLLEEKFYEDLLG